MKALVVFLLSLCFLLLNEHNDVHASVHYNTASYSAGSNIERPQPTKFTKTIQDIPVIKNNTEKREDYSRVEDDEEEDFVFARKYVLLAKSFIALSSTSLSSHFYNDSKNRLPFCGHFSYTSSFKYILQRVLRI